MKKEAIKGKLPLLMRLVMKGIAGGGGDGDDTSRAREKIRMVILGVHQMPRRTWESMVAWSEAQRGRKGDRWG